MDGSRRLAWLEDYASAAIRDADLPAPTRITDGIRFEHVTFGYPVRPAGRSTMSICACPRAPSSLSSGRTGESEPALVAVLDRAVRDVVDALPAGLRTQLGPTWHEGVDVSYGQWQKLPRVRGFMRDEPLIVALDEPTAALDAETEHQLFDRYARRANESKRNGNLTMLVSHRFSTVRMADLIVVMDGARVAEVGSHDELMARGGRCSELYQIQARAYQYAHTGPVYRSSKPDLYVRKGTGSSVPMPRPSSSASQNA